MLWKPELLTAIFWDFAGRKGELSRDKLRGKSVLELGAGVSPLHQGAVPLATCLRKACPLQCSV